MAKAIYEKRTFNNKQTGETIKYEVFGIIANVNGERMELALKSLTPSEKIAWKMLMTGNDDLEKLEAEARKASADELVSHQSNVKKREENVTILDDDEEDESYLN